ncbi:hypothetical protein AWE51_23410 [Aquimarina aggregata]|uniref:TonB C-terminal domain-containing protein n=1 Tax=Aquimarina aggregata TaxID=1642818 RepID=A0A163B717_9FLAO|nr:hypothetical protein [Aquimarina aggregata]KZS41103.1 hypothetical protein AWE51_23410 [Aquimarina aggregata]
MKKNTLIFAIALITISMLIFGFNNRNVSVNTPITKTTSKSLVPEGQITDNYNFNFFPDFLYHVDTRFQAIKKDKINNAISIHDFITLEDIKSITSYKSVSVIILDDNKQTDIRETGTSDLLTNAQIKLLQSAGYSTNILIRADYQKKYTSTGGIYDSYATPHFTVAPEKPATYGNDKNALIQYLKENSRLEVSIIKQNKVQEGKLFFTVTKNGVISNVKLGTSSGHPSVDQKMMELIYKAPEKWKPAENTKGEKVDQELVFFFGTMGC